MTDQENIHFAADPVLVEQFVLGRLNPRSRERCEDHLRTCASCAKAVADETAIAAGVRRLARDEMKKRLSRRVQARPVPGAIPWPRLAAVAALLVTVVGIGYLANWFNWRTGQTASTPGEIAEQKTPILQNESRDKQLETSRAPRSEAGATKVTEGRTDRLEEGSKKENIADGNRPAGKPAQVEEEKSRVPSPPATQAARAQDAVGETLSGAGGEISSQQFWATGTISSDRGRMAAADRALEKREKDAVSSKPLILDQRRSSDLPPTQQALHYQSRTQQIQSLIEERADTLHIVLYVDTPIDRQALAAARAEQIGEDSLIIRLDGQLIGLRLPPPLRQGQKTK
jgi:hypothetical protein